MPGVIAEKVKDDRPTVTLSFLLFILFFFLYYRQTSGKYENTQKNIRLNQPNFGWFNHRIWLLYGQPNFWLSEKKFLVNKIWWINLKSVFAQANKNFVTAVIIIIIFIINIFIKNSTNNILLKKKRKKKISGLSQRQIVPDWIWTCDLWVSYLPT